MPSLSSNCFISNINMSSDKIISVLISFLCTNFSKSMATCEISEMISQRGKTLLLVNNFKYREHHRKLSSGETKWRCFKKNCNAYIHTLGDTGFNRILTEVKENHNHEPESDNILERQQMTASVKRNAESTISERPSKIIRNELMEQGTNLMNLSSVDLKCVKKNMYYARRKLFPALPKSILEVHKAVQELNPKTNRGEEFLQVNDTINNLIIFSCTNNLQALCKSTVIYMDGTFSYCTRFFKQMFTIHGYLNGHYIPLIFCLLKDKCLSTYELCFSKILNVCNTFNLNLSPAEIVIDFEMSIHIAVKRMWNNTKITGCRFHLTQSWYRQIQKLGLVQQYKDTHSEIGKWLHYCFGLVFLKPEDVEDFYFFELYERKPDDDNLEKFSDYLVETYLTPESTYPPHIWADASAALNKTTNACESFHSHFNESMYDTHPTIFIFVNELLNVQSETYVKCNNSNKTHVSKNLASRKKFEFLSRKINEYLNNKISKMDFVKIISHYYGNL